MQIPIRILDEFKDDSVIESTGKLDMASGDIHSVVYTSYDVKSLGAPVNRKGYDFSTGVLQNGEKEVEFCIECNGSGEYSVTADELDELKTTAAALFSGKGLSAKEIQKKVTEGAAISVKRPAAKPATKKVAKKAAVKKPK